MPRTSRSVLLWFAIAVFCLLVLPRMLTYGMFLDGTVHASIARNMAENYGSFWRPYYTETIAPFYEHPPLGFWLQSWAYRLCGDVVYVETLWGLIAGALMLVGVASIWRAHAPREAAQAGAWFPVLLFVIMPMTPWILSNNMLENTMTVFMLASVYASLVSLQAQRCAVSLCYGLLAGLNTCLAFLVKGPVALFTLIVPLASLSKGEQRAQQTLLVTACVILACCGALGGLWATSEAAASFFGHYLRQQIVASLSGQREVTASRWLILYAVGREVIVPLLLCGALTLCFYRRHQGTLRPVQWRLFSYYLGLALISSLPMLISPKQRRWYVFPALPFYVLAIATVFHERALVLEHWLSQNRQACRRLLQCAMAMLVAALLLMVAGRHYVGRHEEFYHDLVLQPLRIEARTMLSVYPEALETQWSLVANMQRLFKTSLTKTPGHPYVLSTLAHRHAAEIPPGYELFHPAHPKKYLVFKRKE